MARQAATNSYISRSFYAVRRAVVEGVGMNRQRTRGHEIVGQAEPVAGQVLVCSASCSFRQSRWSSARAWNWPAAFSAPAASRPWTRAKWATFEPTWKCVSRTRAFCTPRNCVSWGSRWRAWKVKYYLLLIKLNRKKIPRKKKQILRRRRKTKRQSQQARKVI